MNNLERQGKLATKNRNKIHKAKTKHSNLITRATQTGIC